MNAACQRSNAVIRHLSRELPSRAQTEISVYLALFGGGGKEGSPLLLHLWTLAFGTFDVALVVFGHREKQREFLVAGQAQIFILRHGNLREGSAFPIGY